MVSQSECLESQHLGAGSPARPACARLSPRITLSLAGLLTLVPSTSRAGPCPESYICAPLECSGSVAARRDTVFYNWMYCYTGGYWTLQESYDLSRGAIVSQIDGDCGDLSWSGYVDTYDVFRLVGPPSSTPLSFTARAHCAGYWAGTRPIYTGGGVNGRLSEVGGVEIGYSRASFGGTLDTTLVIPLSHAVGEEFTLRVRVGSSVSSFAGARNTSQLSFSGLPPGHAVVSCQGFVSDPVVPARSISWGRLKAHYR